MTCRVNFPGYSTGKTMAEMDKRKWASERWLLPALISLATTLFLLAACGSDTPEAAPDFEIALFQNENHGVGEVFSLSANRGQPAVVNFWYPSCPPCRIEMPHFEQASRKYRDAGLHFVAVQTLGLDTVQDGQDFVEDFELTFAIGPDTAEGDIVKLYEVRHYPSTFFLNENHEIVETWSGPLNEEKLEELIQLVLN